ncbi:ABC transporter permease [Thorsellia kenyensis]|uniref:ABC transporter permease n=1 Tax=Thorsellia kenyensis TaxID=1549888 RepID=A0ABV6CFJ2_9GAMM
MNKNIFYTLILLISVSICSLFIGVAKMDILSIHSWSEGQWNIFWLSRLPRLLSILMAGAGMSIAGLIMQQLTQNRFVSPTTAGTMDFAMLGIVIAMILFAESSLFMKLSVAFIVTFMGSLLFMKILERIRMKDIIFVPLVGIMLGSVVSGVAIFFALKFNLMQSITGWLQGDFSMMTKGRYELLFITLPLIAVAYFFASKFTIVGMGESFAQNLGVSYKQVVFIGLMIVSIIASTIILTVGIIPFLGLIIPNIVSIFHGDNIKTTLPLTALYGSLFILIADILGRVLVAPYEISISLMVGSIGSAIFLVLLFRQQKHEQQ